MRADHGSAGYVAVGVGLIAFGVISLFSIGYPLISMGVAHLALYRVRHRRSIRLPIMAGLVAFWVAFVLVSPIWCVSRDVMGTGEVWCRSFLGARYTDNPSYLPGLIAGTAAAVITVAAVRNRLRNGDTGQR